MDYFKRKNESIMDYEERLYRNQSLYGLKWDQINQLLNIEQHPDSTRKASYGYLRRIDQEIKSSFDKSIMIMGDTHLPYERNDVLENISKHANEIDTLILGGDLLDCESISSFPKIRNLTLEQEIIYAHKFLKEVRKILNNGQKIILIRGNHEDRMKKNICKMQEKDLQKFINPEVLEMLVEGFTIYDNGKKKRFEGIENTIYIPHWFVNVDNKIIVCHPKDFSKVKGKILENTTQHFVNRNEIFDVVVILHTHKISSGLVDRFQGKFAIECGCNCKPHDYSDTGKLSYSPQSYGYVIIKYNNNEKLNLNNLKQYYLSEEKKIDGDCFKIKI